MSLHAALPLSALLAAAYLFFTSGSRLWPALTAAGAGAELALAHGWIRLAVPSHTLSLGLGALIGVPALVLWWRAGGKGPLTGAAVAAFIGVLQVALAALPRLL